jgi:hypothetical protein
LSISDQPQSKRKKEERAMNLQSDPKDILERCNSDFKMSYSACKTMLERLKELEIVAVDAPFLPMSLSTGLRGDLLSMIDRIGFYIRQAESQGHAIEFNVVGDIFLRVTCGSCEYQIARVSDNEYLYSLGGKEAPPLAKVETSEATVPIEHGTTVPMETEEVAGLAEGVGKVSAAKRSVDNAKLYFSQRNYVSAMEEILKVLNEYPRNRSALDLAQSIVYLCMSDTAAQKIPQMIIQDPLLDPIFAECSQCRAFWPVNPLLKDMAHVVVTHPVGGKCETCGKVFCRKCAITDGLFLRCPECNRQLGIIRTPMGRTRIPRKPETGKRIVQVCIFKEAPEPANMRSYVQLVLETLVPEALTTKDVGIYAETTPGEANQLYVLARTMFVKPQLDLEKYDVITQNFTDKDGGRGMVLKVYEKEKV